jgi:hypothetical protein
LKAIAPVLHIKVRTVMMMSAERMTKRAQGSVFRSIRTLFSAGSVGGLLLVDAQGNLAVTNARLGALIAIPGARGELEELILKHLARAKRTTTQERGAGP